jgi:hypothetical protein
LHRRSIARADDARSLISFAFDFKKFAAFRSSASSDVKEEAAVDHFVSGVRRQFVQVPEYFHVLSERHRLESDQSSFGRSARHPRMTRSRYYFDRDVLTLYVRAGCDNVKYGACPFCQRIFMVLMMKAATNRKACFRVCPSSSRLICIRWPGANPTVVTLYNASAVRIYNATSNLCSAFRKQIIFFYFQKTL